jgi:hypothetical protein
MDNFKKYLPSKNFISFILLIVTIVLIFLVGKGVISLIKNRERRGGEKQPEVVSIKEIIDEDDNNNGIPNWEEYFWGLDPKKNGKKNKEFVLSKRELANQGNSSLENGEPVVLTENEALSRDFFVAILALSEEGLLDEDSINTIAETIGQKVVAEPIENRYVSANVILDDKHTIEGIGEYYQKVIDLIVKYNKGKDLGKEITLISIGLGSNDEQALITTRAIAVAYRNLGEELIKIKTPDILIENHLQMANSCEKIAQSIEGLSLAIEDPILAIKSLINYQKYSDEFLATINLVESE